MLGPPQINLALVSWCLKAAKEGWTEVLTWSLPYEIIVAGFYEIVTDEENVADNAPPAPAVTRQEWAANLEDGLPAPASC